MARSKKNLQRIGKEDSQSFTAHTFLPDLSYLDTKRSLYNALDAIGDRYGHSTRSLFKDRIRPGMKPFTFKNVYLVKYGITARQFNAIRFDRTAISVPGT